MPHARVIVTQKQIDQIESDLAVYCLKQTENICPDSDPAIRKMVEKAFELGDFKGSEGEKLTAYAPVEGVPFKARRILISGLGKMADDENESGLADTLRQAGGHIAKVCAAQKVKTLAVKLPDIESIPPDQAARFLTEGILLGDYRFDKYKHSTRKKEDYTGLKTVRIVCVKGIKKIRTAVAAAVSDTCAACRARDMANEPGNGWTSKEFAEYAKQLAQSYSLKFTCLEKEDLQKLGMGGILGVNQGSHIPPRMVILEYIASKKAETILLVGKGITFDSGGISLKPPAGMDEMKYDMCGGAAVLAAMQAVGEQKPLVNVIAIVPATDNMSGSRAIRPGDIIRHYNGVTAEIVNTDAEGRMILGDALSYGIEQYKPDCVIDIATLTGAVIIGLGHHYSGMISNSDALCSVLENAGSLAGEPVWRLPLTKEYKKQIESKVADIKNVGGRPAGSITAGAYLSHFVGDTPWVHMDIAGTAWDFTEKPYIPKGPSGIGVRTFLYLIRSWKKGMLND
jgi:leucyl aminopeptidase